MEFAKQALPPKRPVQDSRGRDSVITGGIASRRYRFIHSSGIPERKILGRTVQEIITHDNSHSSPQGSGVLNRGVLGDARRRRPPVLTVQINSTPHFKSEQREEMIGLVAAVLLMIADHPFDGGPVEQSPSTNLLFREILTDQRFQIVANPCAHGGSETTFLALDNRRGEPRRDSLLQKVLHREPAHF